MAKKKLKRKSLDCDQFLLSQSSNQWPEGCIENENSYTGFSYGTLEETEQEETVQMKIGQEITDNVVHSGLRDGFEISDTDWICKNEYGSIYKLTDLEMQERYED